MVASAILATCKAIMSTMSDQQPAKEITKHPRSISTAINMINVCSYCKCRYIQWIFLPNVLHVKETGNCYIIGLNQHWCLQLFRKLSQNHPTKFCRYTSPPEREMHTAAELRALKPFCQKAPDAFWVCASHVRPEYTDRHADTSHINSSPPE